MLLADSAEPAATAANPRVKMWGNQSLELVQVRPEDSGEYVCQATRPEPWGHVTQVHEIQVMCEYTHTLTHLSRFFVPSTSVRESFPWDFFPFSFFVGSGAGKFGE